MTDVLSAMNLKEDSSKEVFGACLARIENKIRSHAAETHRLLTQSTRLIGSAESKHASAESLKATIVFIALLLNLSSLEFDNSVRLWKYREMSDESIASDTTAEKRGLQPKSPSTESSSLDDVLALVSSEDGYSTEEVETLKKAVDTRLGKAEAPPDLGPALESKPLSGFLSNTGKGRKSEPPATLDGLRQTFSVANRMVEEVGEITYDLSSREWKQIKEVSVLAATEVRQNEIKVRFAQACKAIEELRELKEVTAKDLTLLFEKKHKAARTDLKRTEGEILDEPEKRRLVELVAAFQEIGGVVRHEGTPCNVDLRKRGEMKQFAFRVRRIGGDRQELWQDLKIPKLGFS